MQQYLTATQYIDSDHPDVNSYAKQVVGEAVEAREQAVRLYLAVRDDILYDPYRLTLTLDGMRASSVLRDRKGWCVNKAVLLAATARAVGIPSRLAFADVKNHLVTKRLSETIETDVFAYHGTTEMLLDGEWVRCTPAFNASLCERFGVDPLEWDGETNSLFQPTTNDGQRFMEYVKDRGHDSDLPLDDIIEVFKEIYPEATKKWLGEEEAIEGDFAAEAEAERLAGNG